MGDAANCDLTCCQTPATTSTSPCYTYTCKSPLIKVAVLPATGIANDALCCAAQTATCYSYECKAPLRKKSNAATLVGTPSNALCCEAQAKTCYTYTCVAPLVKKANSAHVALPTTGISAAALKTAQDTACCQTPTCHSYTCKAPLVKKAGANQAVGTASDAVCCVTPVCYSWTCHAPLMKRDNASSLAGVASNDLCCESASCNHYTCTAPTVKKPLAAQPTWGVSSATCCQATTTAQAETNLQTTAEVGTKALTVDATTNFAAGREIVIDENTPIAETNTILSVGVRRLGENGRALATAALNLKTPTQFKHYPGATITMPQIPGITTTPAAGGVTTTPAAGGVTLTPVTPVRLNSKEAIKVNKPAASNMLWIGVGGFVGVAVLMIVKVLRIRRPRASRSVQMDSGAVCEDGSYEQALE